MTASKNNRDEAPIEQLREELARQILLIALDDPNAQFKLDALKSTARAPDRNKAAEAVTNDAMSVFQARVRKAAEARDGSEQ